MDGAVKPVRVVPLWERAELRAVSGDTLRPGGFALTDRAMDRIGAVPGWRVLDVGSGLGASVKRLRSRYGLRAWGVEPSAAQIARSEASSHVIRACGDALPFMDDSFDAVFCECVFSLLDDPETAMNEFQRVVRPGGFLVLTDLYAETNGERNGDSCAGRAVPLDAVRSLVESGGFAIELQEDHSRYLKELAARLVFAAGADEAFECGRRLGYYLMIAKRSEGSDV